MNGVKSYRSSCKRQVADVVEKVVPFCESARRFEDNHDSGEGEGLLRSGGGVSKPKLVIGHQHKMSGDSEAESW